MPRSKFPKRTRQNVLQSALEVFASKGYAQASMDDIAAKAGVTKGALYWHFESKVDLYGAVVTHVLEMQTQDIVPALQKGVSPSEVVEALVSSYLNFYRSNPLVMEFYSNMMIEGKTLTETGIMSTMALAYRSYREAVADALAEGHGKGMPSPKSAAMVLVGALDGIAMQWMIDPKGFDLDEGGKALIDLYSCWARGA